VQFSGRATSAFSSPSSSTGSNQLGNVSCTKRQVVVIGKCTARCPPGRLYQVTIPVEPVQKLHKRIRVAAVDLPAAFECLDDAMRSAAFRSNVQDWAARCHKPIHLAWHNGSEAFIALHHKADVPGCKRFA
jgi:hypothetical protein